MRTVPLAHTPESPVGVAPELLRAGGDGGPLSAPGSAAEAEPVTFTPACFLAALDADVAGASASGGDLGAV